MRKYFFGLCVAIILAMCTFANAADTKIGSVKGDNSTSIQKALNDMNENETLTLCNGTYYVTQPILLNGKKKIVAEDGAKVTIVANAPHLGGDHGAIISVQSPGSSISNISLTSSYQNTSGNLPTYGIFINNGSENTLNTYVWNVNITKTIIGIGMSNSSNTSILNTFISDTGDHAAGVANPAIWINSCKNILIYYGAITGTRQITDTTSAGTPVANCMDGDGEVAAYDSDHVTINGLQHFQSGTSAIYFRNCDDCTIKNTTIVGCFGFAFDIVQGIGSTNGSDDIVVDNNKVYWSGFPMAIFTGNYNSGGQFTNNQAIGCNTLNQPYNSPGINIVDGHGDVYLQNNTADNGEAYWRHP